MGKLGLKIVDELLGWILVATWAIVPLPQFIKNYKRKSVDGYSMEFQYLNQIGFIYYSIYVCYGYYYQQTHEGFAKSIAYQDLIWCLITTVIVYMIAVQCWLYRHTITQPVNPYYLAAMIILVAIGIYNTALALGGQLDWFSKDDGYKAYSWAHFLGYAKSFVSLIKYAPQLLLNYKNKNTNGFSIVQVLLDLFGASAGFLQMFVTAHIHTNPDGSPDYNNVFGNIPKVILSIESIVFSICFIIQHYFVYWDNNQRLALQQNPKESQNILGSSAQRDSSDDIGDSDSSSNHSDNNNIDDLDTNNNNNNNNNISSDMYQGGDLSLINPSGNKSTQQKHSSTGTRIIATTYNTYDGDDIAMIEPTSYRNTSLVGDQDKDQYITVTTQ